MKKLITIRQLYILSILRREPNYIYSTWKELGEEVPDLKIDLSGVREIFRWFEKRKLISELHSGLAKPSRGPKRRLFKLTDSGNRLFRYHFKALENLTSKERKNYAIR